MRWTRRRSGGEARAGNAIDLGHGDGLGRKWKDCGGAPADLRVLPSACAPSTQPKVLATRLKGRGASGEAGQGGLVAVRLRPRALYFW